MRLPSFIRKRVPRFLREWKHPHLKTSPVMGLGDDGTRNKRALVSFLTGAFRLRPANPDNVRFSLIGVARGIVQTLNELGYAVDVAEWSDVKFLPRRKYDLFVGHGGINFEPIARALGPETRKIYFSTGAYWKFHNEQELARVSALNDRRGAALQPDRYIYHSEQWANENAEAILCLGNDFLRQTYGKFPTVRSLNNGAYPVARDGGTSKNFAEARRNFLFFAGGGNVHKGLDLLLETFSRVDAHLWICQLLTPEFSRVYRRELEELPNIHYSGWVPMRSTEFYALAEKCAYAILPSCSEGCAGSVVECLHHGLVPVVSRETTVDTGDYGITLEDCSIGEIIRTVEELSRKSAEWCAEKSLATGAAAEQSFSEAVFLKNIRDAFKAVLERQGGDEKS